MSIAFFDFDGTITTKDSLVEFIQFAVGKPKYYAGLILLSPMLLRYTLKLIPNHIAKERLIAYYFKGCKSKDFELISQKYSQTKLNDIIRPLALEKILWHQSKGHKVVIVSASIRHWLAPWCEKYDIDLISTELEISNHILTGKFSTKNCYGLEKVKRIEAQYKLKDFASIYAYGDSAGDKDLLDLSDYSHYKPFRT